MIVWGVKNTIEPLIVFLYAVGEFRQHIAWPRESGRLRRSGEPDIDTLRNPTSQESRVSFCMLLNRPVIFGDRSCDSLCAISNVEREY